jgi:hypothetical protein
LVGPSSAAIVFRVCVMPLYFNSPLSGTFYIYKRTLAVSMGRVTDSANMAALEAYKRLLAMYEKDPSPSLFYSYILRIIR